MAAQNWVDEVLSYWFETLQPAQWFARSDAVDAAIRGQFLGVHEAVAASADADLLADPRRALAAIIALDQFPRNMFRGSARAFATDAKALGLAEAAIARGHDRDRTSSERLFMYLPFEHSERLAMQMLSVALLSSLADPALRRYALAHKVIIERFGRFPHRNSVLGRATSEAEARFLEGPMSSF